MKTLSAGFDPTALTPYDQNLAGQIYTADDQCAHMRGTGSYFCNVRLTFNSFNFILRQINVVLFIIFIFSGEYLLYCGKSMLFLANYCFVCCEFK